MDAANHDIVAAAVALDMTVGELRNYLVHLEVSGDPGVQKLDIDGSCDTCLAQEVDGGAA